MYTCLIIIFKFLVLYKKQEVANITDIKVCY